MNCPRRDASTDLRATVESWSCQWFLRRREDVARLPSREIPKLVPFRSSTELYLLSLPVTIALSISIVSHKTPKSVQNSSPSQWTGDISSY